MSRERVSVNSLTTPIVRNNNFTINGNLVSRVGRSERIGLVQNGLRVGYNHWTQNWQDSYFWYPQYVFDPFLGVACHPSPWYGYFNLPPYIASSRTVFLNNCAPLWNTWQGNSIFWNRPIWDSPSFDTRRDQRYSDLDYSVDDLVVAFESVSLRAINRLVPRDGFVNIYQDGRYSYSLNPNDFYDMFLDGIENTRTSRYEIVETRSNGRDSRVVARHWFEDSWGQQTSVWHSFTLERDNGGYVIREFYSGQNRPRF